MSEPTAPPPAEPPPPLPPPPRRVEMRLWPLTSLWLIRALVIPLFAAAGFLFMGVFLIGIREQIGRGAISGAFFAFAGGAAFMGLWNYVVIVGGIKTYWLAPRRMRRLFSHGQQATGTVMSKTVTETESSHSYGLTYEYTDSTGRKHTQQTGRVAYRLWKPLHEDQQITVLYDPRSPERSVLYEAGDYLIKQP